MVNYHLSVLNGGSIGAIPTSNPLAHDAWNHARRVRKLAATHDPASPTRAADPTQEEAEKWGALGPGCLIALPQVEQGRGGQSREERLRLTA